MFFPRLKCPKEKVYSVKSFGSLRMGPNVPDGCFSEMENLTGDKFPLMSVRKKRALYCEDEPLYFDGEEITVALDTPAGLMLCTETGLYIDGRRIEDITLFPQNKNRSAVLMGRNIFISPDGVYVKCTDEGIVASSCNFTLGISVVKAQLCLEDGSVLTPDFFGAFPEEAEVGNTLVSNEGSRMMRYSFSGSKWVSQGEAYIKLSCSSGIRGFNAGQSLKLYSSNYFLEDGFYTVKSTPDETLVLSGVLTKEGTIPSVVMSAAIPHMDFAVEHNNRLWGCRYGYNRDGEFVNEIYASRLGNPEEWYSFNGISTDSYSVSLGCSGEFTGAAKVGNEVVFFKENYLVRVRGDEPSEFTVSTIPARGVERGQYRSLVNLGERLFYKGTDGITVYDGTLPFVISERDAFTGYYDSAAGAHNGKYYIALTSPEGERAVYVYDTENLMWHREDDGGNGRLFFSREGNLFLLSCDSIFRHRISAESFDGLSDKNFSLTLPPDRKYSPAREGAVSWYAETGKLARGSTSHNKRIRAVRLSLTLDEGAFVRVLIKTDDSEHFREIFYLDRKTDGIFSASVPVVPCKFFTLRFEGTGDCIIHGFEGTLSLSGEVTDIE